MNAPSSSIRNLALVGILVVTAFVVATVLGLGGSDGSQDASSTTTTTTEPPTTAPPTTAPPTTVPAPTTTIVLPDGDYAAMCVQLQGLADTHGSVTNLDEFQQLFATLDFGVLIAVAPEGIGVYVETLRDLRQQVLDVLAEADSPEDLQASSLPLTFYDSLQHLSAVAVQKCGFADG